MKTQQKPSRKSVSGKEKAQPVVNPDAKSESPKEKARKQQQEVQQNLGRAMLVPLAGMEPCPGLNTRQDMALDELIPSIKAHGIMQPLSCYKGEGEKLYILDGERRYRAALELGMASAPVVLVDKPKDEKQAVLRMLVSNEGKSLRGMELTLAYHKLRSTGMSAAKIAEAVGRGTVHVTEMLTLVFLCQEAQVGLQDGSLTAKQCIALVKATTSKNKETKEISIDYCAQMDKLPELLELRKATQEGQKEKRKATLEGKAKQGEGQGNGEGEPKQEKPKTFGGYAMSLEDAKAMLEDAKADLEACGKEDDEAQAELEVNPQWAAHLEAIRCTEYQRGRIEILSALLGL